MLKIISSIIIFLLFQIQILLSQEFYPNKELDMHKLINFNLTKYNFTDYKKIIGSEVKSWDGDTQRISESSKDWKKIDVKINGTIQELQLNHLKSGGIGFFILSRGLSCETSKSIIPVEYIRKENTLNYISDFDFAKMYIDKFSFDTNKNTRLIYGCMEMLDANNQSTGNYETVVSTIVLSPVNESNNTQVVPLKMIRCKILKSRTRYEVNLKKEKSFNYTYTVLKEPQFTNFYISDSENSLLDEGFRDVGDKMIEFNRDKIHTERRAKLDKTKTERLVFYEEYKIDRIHGDFYVNKIIYDKSYTHAGAPNNELEIEFKGNCFKKDIEERAF